MCAFRFVIKIVAKNALFVRDNGWVAQKVKRLAVG